VSMDDAGGRKDGESGRPRTRTVRLTLTDDDSLVAERRVTLRGRLVRVYPADLLFRFDERKLTERGARRVHALRHETVGARRVLIYVHTDERGGPRHNRSLARARARAVERVLLDGRVPQERRVVRGLGETRPVDPGDHRENRRVVVVVE
jgi:outer membrane protein OmpA-like peptidoglycan-associated protein